MACGLCGGDSALFAQLHNSPRNSPHYPKDSWRQATFPPRVDCAVIRNQGLVHRAQSTTVRSVACERGDARCCLGLMTFSGPPKVPKRFVVAAGDVLTLRGLRPHPQPLVHRAQATHAHTLKHPSICLGAERDSRERHRRASTGPKENYH